MADAPCYSHQTGPPNPQYYAPADSSAGKTKYYTILNVTHQQTLQLETRKKVFLHFTFFLLGYV